MPEITLDDISMFTKGECGVLARALNDLTGWPIKSFEPGLHWFVVTPDGRALDIEGPHEMWIFRHKWGNYPIKDGSRWDVSDDTPSLIRAKQLAPALVEQGVANAQASQAVMVDAAIHPTTQPVSLNPL